MPKHVMKKKRVNGPKTRAKTALLLIDLITDFNFDDGDKLWERTQEIIDPLGRLIKRSRKAGIPVIYVNDNYGNWNEDFEGQVSSVIKSKRGREVAGRIRPEKGDLYILKPQRSGFYETPLAVLLESMQVSSLILAGITTDICVLFTAHDAYMRGYSILVPSDCTAAVEDHYRDQALQLMARVAEADTRPSTEFDSVSSASRNKK